MSSFHSHAQSQNCGVRHRFLVCKLFTKFLQRWRGYTFHASLLLVLVTPVLSCLAAPPFFIPIPTCGVGNTVLSCLAAPPFFIPILTCSVGNARLVKVVLLLLYPYPEVSQDLSLDIRKARKRTLAVCIPSTPNLGAWQCMLHTESLCLSRTGPASLPKMVVICSPSPFYHPSFFHPGLCFHASHAFTGSSIVPCNPTPTSHLSRTTFAEAWR